MRVHPALGIVCFLLLSRPATRSESFQTWCQSYFSPAEMTAGLASPLRDPDADGCLNICEYAGGCSPRDAADCLSLALEMDTPTLHAQTALSGAAIDTTTTCQVSSDLSAWREAPLLQLSPVTLYQLGSHRFSRLAVLPAPGVFIDTDGDGLDDYFEEGLIASDTGDGLTSLADVLPGDDFDGNGTLNLDEPLNAPATSGQTKPALLNPAAVDSALAALSTPDPSGLHIHTPLD